MVLLEETRLFDTVMGDMDRNFLYVPIYNDSGAVDSFGAFLLTFFYSCRQIYSLDINNLAYEDLL